MDSSKVEALVTNSADLLMTDPGEDDL